MLFYSFSHSSTAPLGQIRVKCFAQGHIDRFFTLLAWEIEPANFRLLAQRSNRYCLIIGYKSTIQLDSKQCFHVMFPLFQLKYKEGLKKDTSPSFYSTLPETIETNFAKRQSSMRSQVKNTYVCICC